MRGEILKIMEIFCEMQNSEVKSIKIPLGPLTISNSPIIHHNSPSSPEWDTESEGRVK